MMLVDGGDDGAMKSRGLDDDDARQKIVASPTRMLIVGGDVRATKS